MENNNEVRTLVRRYFKVIENDFEKTACEALSRIERADWEADADEAVRNAITDAMIYTEDKWAVMKHYCTPEMADIDMAEAIFYLDLENLASKMFAED